MKIANVALNGGLKFGSRLCKWLKHERPDIVTLQKVGPKKNLPTELLYEIGYESKCLGEVPVPYLGIAVLSKRTLPSPEVLFCDLPGTRNSESRFLTVKIGGLWVSSVYAPYCPGGPATTCKQAIELRVAWLQRLRDHVYHRGYTYHGSLLCGDFNVKVNADGPLKKTGCFSEKEQVALQELLDLGFVDLYREFHPKYERKPGFTRGYSEKWPDGTSRLHLMLASENLFSHFKSADLDDEPNPFKATCKENVPNRWPRKDAPPVIAKFDRAGLEARIRGNP